jgi:hypothetical protein
MDIVLTGIARSGTTLTCSLLNGLPRCVALHEPMRPKTLAGLDFPEGYLSAVGSFFSAERETLLAGGLARSKAIGGSVPDNPYGSSKDRQGLRRSMVEGRGIHVDKPLEPGFRLVIKHPALFTATLAALQTRFPCYAVVRNPLASMLSWHTIQSRVNRGRIQDAEAFDAGLKASLDAEPDVIERQVTIIRWSLARYATLLPPGHVIRYEELVASRGRALAVIDPEAASLDEPLENRNANPIYDASMVRRIADRLLADPSIYAGFYTASDIADLRDRWAAAR